MVRVPVQVRMVHRPLEVVAVEAGHRGARGRGVLVMLYREAGRRSGHEILKAQIRVPAADSTPGEFEAPPAPAAPLHAVVGKRRLR